MADAHAAVRATRVTVFVNVCRYTTRSSVQYQDMLRLLTDVAVVSALVQMVVLVAIMVTGNPGIYVPEMGFMYVSNNFCRQQLLASAFFLATIPSWVLLACSVCNVGRWRWVSLALLALPLPMGLGVVWFPICTNATMHYVYVNAFVFAVGCVHLAVANTGKHTEFMRTYAVLVIGTAVCGSVFMIFALLERGPGVVRNVATISEYLAISGFIFINSLSCDRIREHILVGYNPARWPCASTTPPRFP